jgi:hypothetical protein
LASKFIRLRRDAFAVRAFGILNFVVFLLEPKFFLFPFPLYIYIIIQQRFRLRLNDTVVYY